MVPLLIVGALFLVAGVAYLVRSASIAETLRDVNVVAKGLYTPAAVGCAGVFMILGGVVALVVALVVGAAG